ncbi:HD domain-containing protein [Robertmurraya beringensis]|uniref:HD domain-containing protein n=1 Tax=Robertmurraya beringensis TaxID=641660 RepID=A0ABV6KV62_9BACI
MAKMVKTDTQQLVGDLFLHDLTTYQHSLRVGDELFRFASYLHLEDVETIYVLGILHDIGKLGIPHALLCGFYYKMSLFKNNLSLDFLYMS